MVKAKKCLEEISSYETDKYKNNSRLKLDLNENIYGCEAYILNAIRNFNLEDISLYPKYGELIDILSKKYQLKDENFLLTNGCNEAIYAIINTYLDYDNEILLYNPTISLPERYAKITGGKIKYIEYEKKFSFDVEKIKENISQNTKIVYIATPNNPTGEIAEPLDLDDIIGKYQDILFIIDCTYINYAQNVRFEDYINLINYKNTIIIKSFSKDFALAGLRIGFCAGNKEIIDNLKKAISPYSVNAVAIKCAMYAIKNEENFEKIKQANKQSKELLFDGLLKLGFEPYPSEANFILCNFGKFCEFYYQKLRKNGVIVKKYPNTTIENCLRITIPKIGGVKYILELLKPKNVIVFNLAEKYFINKEKLSISKGAFAQLAQNNDLVIISDKKIDETENILKEFDISDYFCFISVLENIKNISDFIQKFANTCPHKTIKYIGDGIGDASICNENIEIIGIVSSEQNKNQILNSFRHSGTKHIFENTTDLEKFLTKQTDILLEI